MRRERGARGEKRDGGVNVKRTKKEEKASAGKWERKPGSGGRVLVAKACPWSPSRWRVGPRDTEPSGSHAAPGCAQGRWAGRGHPGTTPPTPASPRDSRRSGIPESEVAAPSESLAPGEAVVFKLLNVGALSFLLLVPLCLCAPAPPPSPYLPKVRRRQASGP